MTRGSGVAELSFSREAALSARLDTYMTWMPSTSRGTRESDLRGDASAGQGSQQCRRQGHLHRSRMTAVTLLFYSFNAFVHSLIHQFVHSTSC